MTGIVKNLAPKPPRFAPTQALSLFLEVDTDTDTDIHTDTDIIDVTADIFPSSTINACESLSE